MKIAMWVVVGLVLLVLIVVVVGYLLPVAHTASREKTLAVPADTVFAIISAPADFPKWRSDVKSVDLLPPEGGRSRFRETGSNGAITFEEVERVPAKRLVTRIAGAGLPFGGRWTYELTPSGSGTTLRITEDGEVYNPVFRFMSRFVFGHTATMEKYLADLEKRVSKG